MKLFWNFLQNSNCTRLFKFCKFSSITKTEPIQIPTKTLNNGCEMPVLGLGTWESLEDDVKAAVKIAICCGYRMIDTAYLYQNEKHVGHAIKEMIKEKIVKRNDLFITSKLWNTFHLPESVMKGVRLSLNNLNLSYLDLYLIHWPTGYQEGDILIPRDAKGNTKYSDVDYVETWKAMEKVQKRGLAKSIGLSNFNKSQIERILEIATIKPAVLQCECHPFLNQAKLRDFCNSKNITFTAYSPLGGSKTRPFAVQGEERLMESKDIIKIAERNKRTPAQILIRFQIQLGNIVIPKSVNECEIKSNLQVFDWELSADDMNELIKMNKNHRYVNMVEVSGKHKHYPFNGEY